MKGPLILLAHSLKRVRTLVIVMGVVLAVFQVFLVLVAGTIQRSNTFEQIGALVPPFLRGLLGPSFTAFMSFGGIVCLGYFHVAVMGALIALAIALGTTPTSEMETGFMDLILARPLARHWIITRAIIVVLICGVAVVGMLMFGTWVGLNTLAPKDVAWPSPKMVVSLATNLGLIMLCWAGVAMAIGSVARRRSVAGAMAGLLALSTFLLDYVARAWEPAESIAWLSPFRYYSPFELVMGKSLPAKNVLVLTSIAVVSFAIAYVFFSRRDISH
jgi:ABC-2 type transport system permease protein